MLNAQFLMCFLGMTSNDVKVDFKDGLLTISGERKGLN